MLPNKPAIELTRIKSADTPEAVFVFAQRKKIMQQQIETVRKLWRGESIQMPGGTGEPVEIKVFPKPIQREAA